MKKEMVGDVPGSTLGMLGDLMLKLKHGSLTERQLELFLKGQNPFVGPENILEEWYRFYRDIFSVDPKIDNIVFPQDRPGFEWIVVPTPVVPTNEVVRIHKELWDFWSYYDDLETVIPENERTYLSCPYAIRVRARVEADEELKNKSASNIKTMGITTITVDERLRLELWYAWKTGNGKPKKGEHLDVYNVTLCSGSRDSVSIVPHVRWLPVYRRLSVNFYDPGFAFDFLRSREVVS